MSTGWHLGDVVRDGRGQAWVVVCIKADGEPVFSRIEGVRYPVV